LFSGERVFKSHVRVEAYGEIDELNSVLGAVAAALPEKGKALTEEIGRVQSDLLSLGALLATTPQSPNFGSLEPFDTERSKYLESAIDRMDEQLPPLRNFILPGGHMSAAWSHVARTVCRRAERRIIALSLEPDTELPTEFFEPLVTYINRLSDYLFMLARYCNFLAGVSDIPWKK
jgi:cob(I)alamin adenosyltransferase